MYQGLSVMALDIFARSQFLSAKTRDLARASHINAQRAWLTMTHPDGEIALFNDSWFGEVPRPRDIIGDADLEPANLLADAGYARLEADGVFALMDAGSIGPRWNPGHGHADFLAVEADVGGKRFIVDPGTFQYSTGPRRAFERSAQSHNGPIRTGVEPVEYRGCFRVGRMSRAEFVDYATTTDGASVRGRLRLPDGSSVQRSVDVSPGHIRITDEWIGDADGARVRLTVPDDWVLRDQDFNLVTFRNGAEEASIYVDSGRVGDVTHGDWSCRYLESRHATIVELRPSDDTSDPRRIVWGVRTT